MTLHRPYFFCGIGGSGMLPLALIVQASGHPVSGSDRALDQGRLAQKFDHLRARGVALFPQDGSGVTDPDTIVVTSTAVEATIPDVKAAERIGATLMTRAELLAQLFNASKTGVGIAGTSGKSTTTGMIGWILKALGRDPTVMNGAVMKNFVSADQPFASALVGAGGIFVSEVDESDGSIARYTPRIAVLNNVSLDHKTMDELRTLFGDFLARAELSVVNLDDAETARLAAKLPADRKLTYSLDQANADLLATGIVPASDGIAFYVREKNGAPQHVRLKVPGRHNISNALAALGAVRAVGVALSDAVRVLEQFGGVKRRLETVGTARGVTIIDDFAHNPDKIAATLNTLHDFSGRLLVMFQPHGYGPLANMKQEFIEGFATHLHEDDILVMPEPVYFGGTVDRRVTSADIAEGIRARGRKAQALPDREACGTELLAIARADDRIVVMGARDDTLSHFAAELLQQISSR